MSAPPPPSPTANQVPLGRDLTTQNVQHETAGPKDICQSASWTEINQSPKTICTVKTLKSSHASKTESGLKVPGSLGSELVEIVRKNTDLSYELSQLAVGSVLTHIGHSVPGIGATMENILKTMVEQDEKKAVGDLELTHDGRRLQMIFEELAACKDDSQQRSWFLHEDEHVITGHLEELLSILTNANPEVCKRVVSQDNYEAVENLVLYYQMETRVSIRLWLLQCFGALCALEAEVISALLNSVLPLELSRDMQADIADIQKLSFSALVLTMVLSMGEAVPLHYYEHLNSQLIEFLLSNIESSPANDTNDQIPDMFLKLILAFNLHFELPAENMVMKVLAQTGTAKTFTEKLMLLVNRADDPVRMFDHKPEPPDSLLKFLSDLYSSPGTSTLLYTNDEMVLIDITLRHLADLSPGDKGRTDYLSLIHLICRNSNYAEHQHRRRELENCFTRICREEGSEGEMDKRIVKQIFQEFPDLFAGQD